MTSVVDTSVKHFHSAMVGAPVLNGVAGALIAMLDACLVNGFDVKAATSLVVAGGVATLSFSGTHSATVDSVPLISGVTGAMTALNGEQKVTAIGPGFIKFATAAADGTATGTLSFKMAPAGWAIAFTGTNLRAYKSTDPASTGMYLRVDDTGTTSARVVGYEQMTDINTGTGPFPTTAQVSGGGYWVKSGVASAAAVKWTLAADARGFVLSVAPYWTAATPYIMGATTRWFGDVAAVRPGGDPYSCALNYSISTSTTAIDGQVELGNHTQIALPRGYTGLGSSELNYCRPLVGGSNYYSGADALLGSFPPPDGSLILCKRFFSTTQTTTPPRAYLPAIYSVPMERLFDVFKPLDIVVGTGALAGRKLLALSPSYGSISAASTANNTGISFVDITGPWAR